MAKPFDASAKYLLEAFPEDWPAYLGTAGGWPVRAVDADLSTVTSEADKVLLVEAPERWLMHVEVQARHDLTIPARLLRYNVLLDEKHGLPVQSVVLILRPAADSPGLTGHYERRVPGEDIHHEFRYKVVRAWRQPVGPILEGGIGTLPLAPIADVPQEALPGVIRRMQERLDREAPPEISGRLWTSTYVLMGLLYEKEIVSHLLRGVRGMKESVTYQAILEEGEAKGEAKGEANAVRRLLVHLGTIRFGPPPPKVVEAIEAISGTRKLEAMAERLIGVSNWQELMEESWA